MKCDRHPEADAVGVCMACGRGVCDACRVLYREVVHCPICLQAGRVAPGRTTEVRRGPRPRPSRALLLMGLLGTVVLFVGAVATLTLRSLMVVFTIARVAVDQPDSALQLFLGAASSASASLLGLGVILFSLGLVGLDRPHGQGMAPAAATMVLAASALYLPRLPALPAAGAGAYPLGIPGPAPAILWGGAWVLVGLDLVLLARVAPGVGAPATAGGFWVVAGVLLGSVLGDAYGVGWAPFAVACYLTYRTLARSPGPAPAPAPRPGPEVPPPPIDTGSSSTREGGPPPYPDFPGVSRR